MSNSTQQHQYNIDWSTLPAPEDDGGADHLIGMTLPSLTLTATSGPPVELASLGGTTVIFAYPRTGPANGQLPDGWDMIPGARGCTPQACAFRDMHGELKAAGVQNVFGLSTQGASYQLEMAKRLHLTFPVLADPNLELAEALNLPIIEVETMILLKRLTMVLVDGKVVKTFYPVFPPDQSAQQVLNWLTEN